MFDEKTLGAAAAARAKTAKAIEDAKLKFAAKQKVDESGEEDLNKKSEKRAAKERKIDAALEKAKAAPKPSRVPKQADGGERIVSEALADSQMFVEVESSHRRSTHHRAGRKHMNRVSSHKNLASETYLVPEKIFME